jgi:subtilisin family serine protease
MATQLNQALDPRLRRLVHSIPDSRRLVRDLAESVVSAAREARPSSPVRADEITTRVLVRVANGAEPPDVPDVEWKFIADGICSAEVPIVRLEDLAAHPEVEFVEAARVMVPTLSTSLAETKAGRLHASLPTGSGLTGTGVIVGIVDFGLDFTLDDFITPGGETRVAFIWDQDLSPIAGERSPARFNYGVEYDSADINKALQAPDPFSVVRHKPGVGSHGTHVAGIAAGSGRSGDAAFPAGQFVGAAPGSTIIYVQPSTRGEEGSFTDSVHVAEAISYIFDKARQLDMPCVVNMSLNQNGGSHDGQSVVERAIDRLIEERSRAYVGAAGNEHVWRGHASGRLDTGQQRVLRWKAGGQMPLPGGGQLPPGNGDGTPNQLEIWYSSRDRFNVTLTSPDGQATAVVRPGETEIHNFGNGNTAFIDSERFTVLNGDARIFIEVSPGAGNVVADGVWKVTIEALDSRDGRFDAWIERDARDQPNNFADQSFFVGADFDGEMTLGTPATTRRGICVANYNHVTVAINNSSSRGRTRDGRDKPEVSAPGTNILSSNALGGRPGIGGQPNPMRVAKSGTSMSAPHVTGTVALLFQRRPGLSAAQLQKVLIAAANPPAGHQPFDLAFGYGRLDAEQALRLLD